MSKQFLATGRVSRGYLKKHALEHVGNGNGYSTERCARRLFGTFVSSKDFRTLGRLPFSSCHTLLRTQTRYFWAFNRYFFRVRGLPELAKSSKKRPFGSIGHGLIPTPALTKMSGHLGLGILVGQKKVVGGHFFPMTSPPGRGNGTVSSYTESNRLHLQCGSTARCKLKHWMASSVRVEAEAEAESEREPIHVFTLPPAINPELWKMYGWTHEDYYRRSISQESIDFSFARVGPIPEEARKLLSELKENSFFWLALRKHVDEYDAIWILEVLKRYSTWRRDKTLREESLEAILRREYLDLYSEIKWYADDPNWVHSEMVARKLLKNQSVDVWGWNPVAEPSCVSTDRGDAVQGCRCCGHEKTKRYGVAEVVGRRVTNVRLATQSFLVQGAQTFVFPFRCRFVQIQNSLDANTY